MAENRLSLTLAQESVDDIKKALNTLKEKMPFLISLTPEERKNMIKFGDKSLAFVKKALDVATTNPDILPRKFEVEEMRKDITLFEQLSSIEREFTILYEKLDDTVKTAGSEAYAAALVVYSGAKMNGADVGGLNEVLDDLGKRFARKTPKKTP